MLPNVGQHRSKTSQQLSVVANRVACNRVVQGSYCGSTRGVLLGAYWGPTGVGSYWGPVGVFLGSKLRVGLGSHWGPSGVLPGTCWGCLWATGVLLGSGRGAPGLWRPAWVELRSYRDPTVDLLRSFWGDARPNSANDLSTSTKFGQPCVESWLRNCFLGEGLCKRPASFVLKGGKLGRKFFFFAPPDARLSPT